MVELGNQLRGVAGREGKKEKEQKIKYLTENG